MILSSILSLFGCNPKEKFLKEHDVILCYSSYKEEKIEDKALEFEKTAKIKFKDASDIYINFLKENKDIKKEKIIYPELIIDGNYVYSFKNNKTLDIAVFGVWINSQSGLISNNETELWLNERTITKFYK